uniref:BsaAI n=1 Tax=Geobacillus stearothermophilus TaxID=1422 RepID=E5LGA6_GEOSE|nr:BsaAI [Geobacillus stearothermophilus]
MYNYLLNENADIIYDGKVILTKEQVVEAIIITNTNLKKLNDITKESGVEVFEALGMRNLSGFIGEFFVSSLEQVSNKNLVKNPHQDGYPDLLLVDSPKAASYFNSIVEIVDGKLYPKEKSLFSPFKYGGLEVKATCGSTPSAKVMPKPLIGEQRIHILTGLDWKAHHRGTNNLIGIYWDFLDELPTICAVFYRNDLTEDDWGKIVRPKEGGGRTTSVSIMNSKGVKKMCKNWIAIIDNEDYINAFSNKKWIGYNVKNSSN